MRAVKSVSIDSERRVIITYLDGSTETLYPNCIWCDSEALRQLIKDLLEEKADAITQTIENVTIATFADGADEGLIKKLLVSIDPIQDLHGYDSPWSAGGSVNKLPHLVDGTYTGNGITAVVKDGVCTFSGTTTATGNAFIIPLAEPCVVPENAYMHYLNSDANTSLEPRFESASKPSEGFGHSLSPVNRIATIFGVAGKTIDRVRFYVGNGITISGTFSPMICLTDAVTPWTPYSNICPISGMTVVNVVRSGKNLIPANAFISATKQGLTYTVNPDGTVSVSGTATTNSYLIYDVTFPVNVIINGIPEINDVEIEGTAIQIYSEEAGIGRTLIKNNNTFVLLANHPVQLRLRINSGVTVDNAVFKPMARLATDTDYSFEPYQGETYSVNWQTEAGTVYGATLDVVSGKLTVDSGYIASYNGETLPSTWISDRDAYAVGTTPTTGAQVVYKLAEPIEYQLTPQEARTLLGENNIWADSGNILELEYTADTKLYIGEQQSGTSGTLGSSMHTITIPDIQPVSEKTLEDVAEAYKEEATDERGEE